MQPAAIGKEEDVLRAKEARNAVKLEAEAALDAVKLEAEAAQATGQEPPQASLEGAEGAEEQEETEEALERVDENLLILQDYVFDQDVKVADILRENNMEITKFWRFECGEELFESKAQHVC